MLRTRNRTRRPQHLALERLESRALLATLIRSSAGQPIPFTSSGPNFIAESRIGDAGSRTTFEFDLSHNTAQPLVTNNFAWQSGVPSTFTLTYDQAADTLTFAVPGSTPFGSGGTRPQPDTMQITPGLRQNPTFNTLKLFAVSRLAANTTFSSVLVDDLVFNGESLNDLGDGTILVESGASETLYLAGIPDGSFTLTGSITMTWSGERPRQSAMNTLFSTGTINGTDLAVVKIADESTVLVGEPITFTVDVTNRGPQATSGVVIADALPAGLTFVSATPTQGTYDPMTGLWSVGSLGLDTTATLRLTATAAAEGLYENLAQLNATDVPDIDPNNDRASSAVQVFDPGPPPEPVVRYQASGVVFVDVNQNGQRDPEDPGLPGVEVTLVDSSDRIVGTRVTGPDGGYIFSDLDNGNYVMIAAQPPGYGNITPNAIPFTIEDTDRRMLDFAVALNPAGDDGLLSGFVYWDANHNGVYDPGEPGLANVVVTLTGTTDQGTPVSVQATTTATGQYLFLQLAPGTFTLAPGSVAPFRPYGVEVGGLGGSVSGYRVVEINLGPDAAGDAYNFGALQPVGSKLRHRAILAPGYVAGLERRRAANPERFDRYHPVAGPGLGRGELPAGHGPIPTRRSGILPRLPEFGRRALVVSGRRRTIVLA